MRMRKLVLGLSLAQVFPEKINKIVTPNSLGFIYVNRTVNVIMYFDVQMINDQSPKKFENFFRATVSFEPGSIWWKPSILPLRYRGKSFSEKIIHYIIVRNFTSNRLMTPHSIIARPLCRASLQTQLLYQPTTLQRRYENR